MRLHLRTGFSFPRNKQWPSGTQETTHGWKKSVLRPVLPDSNSAIDCALSLLHSLLRILEGCVPDTDRGAPAAALVRQNSTVSNHCFSSSNLDAWRWLFRWISELVLAVVNPSF